MRSLDEIISGFKAMSSALGTTASSHEDGNLYATPPGSVLGPLTMTQPQPVMQPGQASASIIAQARSLPGGLPQFNFGGSQGVQQSWQMTNAFGGMGPPMGYMAPPQFGIFRGQVPSSVPQGGGMVPPISSPYPALPSTPMFTNPAYFSAQQAIQQSRQGEMGAFSNDIAGIRLGLAGASAFGMGSMGAAVGARLGGARGAIAGGLAGSIGGAALGMHPAMGNLAEYIGAPEMQRRAYAMRIQDSSMNWFAGEDASATGRGMTAQGSSRIARSAATTAASSGNMFNTRDIVNLTQMSGESGLLDFARNSDDIAKALTAMTKVMATMAKVSGDPDFKNNIRTLSQMQQFGLTPLETAGMMGGLRGMARLSNTDLNTMLGREGMAGVATFQSSGLLAGAGALAAIRGAGITRAMMSGGAVNPTQASLFGGESGMIQNYVNGQAGFLSGPGMPMLASVMQMRNGSLGLNNELVDKLSSGKMDIMEMMRRASGNMGSVEAISQFQTRSPELMAGLTKRLGPMGTEMAMFRMAKALQKAMGGERAGVSLEMSLSNLTGDPRMARQLMLSMNSERVQREFDQLNVSGQEDRMSSTRYNNSMHGAFMRSARNAYVDITNPDLFASTEYSDFIRGRDDEDKRAKAMGIENYHILAKPIERRHAMEFMRTAGLYNPTLDKSLLTHGGFTAQMQEGIFGSGFDKLSEIRRQNAGGIGGIVANTIGALSPMDLAGKSSLLGIGIGAALPDWMSRGTSFNALSELGGRMVLNAAGRGTGNIPKEIMDENMRALSGLQSGARTLQRGQGMATKDLFSNMDTLGKKYGTGTVNRAMTELSKYVEAQADKFNMTRDNINLNSNMLNKAKELLPGASDTEIQQLTEMAVSQSSISDKEKITALNTQIAGAAGGGAWALASRDAKNLATGFKSRRESNVEFLMGREGSPWNFLSKRDNEKADIVTQKLQEMAIDAAGGDSSKGKLIMDAVMLLQSGTQISELSSKGFPRDIIEKAVSLSGSLTDKFSKGEMEGFRSITKSLKGLGINERISRTMEFGRRSTKDTGFAAMASGVLTLGNKLGIEAGGSPIELAQQIAAGKASSKVPESIMKAAKAFAASPNDEKVQMAFLTAAQSSGLTDFTGTAKLFSEDAADQGITGSDESAETNKSRDLLSKFAEDFKDDMKKSGEDISSGGADIKAAAEIFRDTFSGIKPIVNMNEAVQRATRNDGG